MTHTTLLKTISIGFKKLWHRFEKFRSPPDTPFCEVCIEVGYKQDPECADCKKIWHQQIESEVTPPLS